MRPITQEKIDRLLAFMKDEQLDAILLADWENARDVNMRYLSGHPMDASLVFKADGATCLIPWDLQLAEDHAEVDEVIDPNNFQRQWVAAAVHYLKDNVSKESPIIAVNSGIPYKYVLETQQRYPEAKIYDNPDNIHNQFSELRSTKSPQELDYLLEAGKIGNKTLKDIRRFAEEQREEGTENDLSFLVQKKLKEYGAEDNSFPSLVANVTRSYQIHCHPMAGNGVFGKEGLALIDFGALYHGYASDITVPFTFGKLSAEQEKIRETTVKAYNAAIEAIELGVPLWKISQTAVDVIEEAGYTLPHSLGHGLGLTVHDAPSVRQKPTDEIALQKWTEREVEEGMVFTIEPGVYVKGQGGLRLENDVMIRNGKVEVYTNSELIEIP